MATDPRDTPRLLQIEVQEMPVDNQCFVFVSGDPERLPVLSDVLRSQGYYQTTANIYVQTGEFDTLLPGLLGPLSLILETNDLLIFMGKRNGVLTAQTVTRYLSNDSTGDERDATSKHLHRFQSHETHRRLEMAVTHWLQANGWDSNSTNDLTPLPVTTALRRTWRLRLHHGYAPVLYQRGGDLGALLEDSHWIVGCATETYLFLFLSADYEVQLVLSNT